MCFMINCSNFFFILHGNQNCPVTKRKTNRRLPILTIPIIAKQKAHQESIKDPSRRLPSLLSRAAEPRVASRASFPLPRAATEGGRLRLSDGTSRSIIVPLTNLPRKFCRVVITHSHATPRFHQTTQSTSLDHLFKPGNSTHGPITVASEGFAC